MTPNSAYTLVDIVEGQDYSPQPTYETVGSTQVLKGHTPPIYGLLCTKGGTAGNIQIMTLGMSSPLSIPATTFKQGVVYYMYLKELVDDNSADVIFVGFQYKDTPQIF